MGDHTANRMKGFQYLQPVHYRYYVAIRMHHYRTLKCERGLFTLYINCRLVIVNYSFFWTIRREISVITKRSESLRMYMGNRKSVLCSPSDEYTNSNIELTPPRYLCVTVCKNDIIFIQRNLLQFNEMHIRWGKNERVFAD